MDLPQSFQLAHGPALCDLLQRGLQSPQLTTLVEEASTRAGYGPLLCSLLRPHTEAPPLSPDTRVLLAISVRNYVRRRWPPSSPEDRSHVRVELLASCLGEADERVRSQLCVALGRVVRCDWPKEWVDAMQCLLSAAEAPAAVLSSASPSDTSPAALAAEASLFRFVSSLHCVLKELESARLAADTRRLSALCDSLLGPVQAVWAVLMRRAGAAAASGVSTTAAAREIAGPSAGPLSAPSPTPHAEAAALLASVRFAAAATKVVARLSTRCSHACIRHASAISVFSGIGAALPSMVELLHATLPPLRLQRCTCSGGGSGGAVPASLHQQQQQQQGLHRHTAGGAGGSSSSMLSLSSSPSWSSSSRDDYNDDDDDDDDDDDGDGGGGPPPLSAALAKLIRRCVDVTNAAAERHPLSLASLGATAAFARLYAGILLSGSASASSSGVSSGTFGGGGVTSPVQAPSPRASMCPVHHSAVVMVPSGDVARAGAGSPFAFAFSGATNGQQQQQLLQQSPRYPTNNSSHFPPPPRLYACALEQPIFRCMLTFMTRLVDCANKLAPVAGAAAAAAASASPASTAFYTTTAAAGAHSSNAARPTTSATARQAVYDDLEAPSGVSSVVVPSDAGDAADAGDAPSYRDKAAGVILSVAGELFSTALKQQQQQQQQQPSPIPISSRLDGWLVLLCESAFLPSRPELREWAEDSENWALEAEGAARESSVRAGAEALLLSLVSVEGIAGHILTRVYALMGEHEAAFLACVDACFNSSNNHGGGGNAALSDAALASLSVSAANLDAAYTSLGLCAGDAMARGVLTSERFCGWAVGRDAPLARVLHVCGVPQLARVETAALGSAAGTASVHSLSEYMTQAGSAAVQPFVRSGSSLSGGSNAGSIGIAAPSGALLHALHHASSHHAPSRHAAAALTLLLRRCLWTLSCCFGVAPMPALHAPLLRLCVDIIGDANSNSSGGSGSGGGSTHAPSPASSPSAPSAAGANGGGRPPSPGQSLLTSGVTAAAMPMGVRLAALSILTQLLESTSFGDESALPPDAVGAVAGALFRAVGACAQVDSTLQLLAALSSLLGLVRPSTLLSVADAIVSPLPSLWAAASANGSFLIRKQVLGVLTQVVSAVGDARAEARGSSSVASTASYTSANTASAVPAAAAAAAAPPISLPPAFLCALLPLVSTSVEGPDAVFLSGDALALWMALLEATSSGGRENSAVAAPSSASATLTGAALHSSSGGGSGDAGSALDSLLPLLARLASDPTLDGELVGPLCSVLAGYLSRARAGAGNTAALLLSPYTQQQHSSSAGHRAAGAPAPLTTSTSRDWTDVAGASTSSSSSATGAASAASSLSPTSSSPPSVLATVCIGLMCAAPPRLVRSVLRVVDGAVVRCCSGISGGGSGYNCNDGGSSGGTFSDACGAPRAATLGLPPGVLLESTIAPLFRALLAFWVDGSVATAAAAAATAASAPSSQHSKSALITSLRESRVSTSHGGHHMSMSSSSAPSTTPKAGASSSNTSSTSSSSGGPPPLLYTLALLPPSVSALSSAWCDPDVHRDVAAVAARLVNAACVDGSGGVSSAAMFNLIHSTAGHMLTRAAAAAVSAQQQLSPHNLNFNFQSADAPTSAPPSPSLSLFPAGSAPFALAAWGVSHLAHAAASQRVCVWLTDAALAAAVDSGCSSSGSSGAFADENVAIGNSTSGSSGGDANQQLSLALLRLLPLALRMQSGVGGELARMGGGGTASGETAQRLEAVRTMLCTPDFDVLSDSLARFDAVISLASATIEHTARAEAAERAALDQHLLLQQQGGSGGGLRFGGGGRTGAAATASASSGSSARYPLGIDAPEPEEDAHLRFGDTSSHSSVSPYDGLFGDGALSSVRLLRGLGEGLRDTQSVIGAAQLNALLTPAMGASGTLQAQLHELQKLAP